MKKHEHHDVNIIAKAVKKAKKAIDEPKSDSTSSKARAVGGKKNARKK